ncbi:MAG TPA: hypothetical protein VF178_00215, partial [Gemmatimonadaceae bacterium]
MPTWIRLDGDARPLNPRHAAIAAVVVGAAIAGLVIRAGDSPPGSADIDQVWFAARALLAGQNPYEMIGPGRAFDYPWPLYYPLPAVVLLAPLAPLPLVWTRLAIAVIPAALLAYLLARRDWRWLSLCFSRAF